MPLHISTYGFRSFNALQILGVSGEPNPRPRLPFRNREKMAYKRYQAHFIAVDSSGSGDEWDRAKRAFMCRINPHKCKNISSIDESFTSRMVLLIQQDCARK